AVLSIVGHRVNSWRVLRRPDDSRGQFWVRLSNFVMARPWRVFLPTFAFLLLLGIPFLNANLSSPDASILPERVDSRQGFEILRDEFSAGEQSPIIIALESEDPVTDDANLAALYDYTRSLAADDRVYRIDSIVSLDPRLNLDQYQLMYRDPIGVNDPLLSEGLARLASEQTTAILVYPTASSSTSEAKSLVRHIRDEPPPGAFSMLVDGGTAEIIDVVDAMYDVFPYVAAFILVVTYVVLMLQFQSIILPLKAILVNALSIVASFGAVVFIFQEGNFSSLLGFDPLGYVEASQPIIMFCLLFGLSMDYEVFLLSRVRESYQETGDNQQSVAVGLQRSGRIITGAALIVVLVTSSFVSAEIVLVKSLGLGIAIAILIDATIVRALLVPATMRLLGDRNWWFPSRLRRLIS
ncbi:MAG: MMPL family transporter, partial [Chloroflexota bacterium]